MREVREETLCAISEYFSGGVGRRSDPAAFIQTLPGRRREAPDLGCS
jgi:hypothetical protein